MSPLLIVFAYPLAQSPSPIALLKRNSHVDLIKDLQQPTVRLETLGGPFKRASGLGEHQRVRAPPALQRVFDVAGMPANHADQMVTHVFTGRDPADLVGGMGKEGIELAAVLARASHFRRASPIGWRCRLFGGGRYELLPD